jgi:Fe-S-cluster containining protein
MSEIIESDNKTKLTRMDEDHHFNFDCSPGVSCFTHCCHDVTIMLTPYDVLRLKNHLELSSEDFLDRYTLVIPKEKRLIPMVVLKMDEKTKRCPFVSDQGCSVYGDRPWPCRMFPLDMNDDGTVRILPDIPFCQGFTQGKKTVISEWLIEQGIAIYDEMNTLFSQVTAPLRAKESDINNPKIYRMTFMALYNLDKFREFVFRSTFLDRFELEETTVEKIKRSDIELLKFAFDWIKFGIFGQKTFQVKQDSKSKVE